MTDEITAEASAEDLRAWRQEICNFEVEDEAYVLAFDLFLDSLDARAKATDEVPDTLVAAAQALADLYPEDAAAAEADREVRHRFVIHANAIHHRLVAMSYLDEAGHLEAWSGPDQDGPMEPAMIAATLTARLSIGEDGRPGFNPLDFLCKARAYEARRPLGGFG